MFKSEGTIYSNSERSEQIFCFLKLVTGGLVEEWLVYMFSSYRKFEFLFLSLCVYLFKNCPSQFLNHWESAEPMFCSEELCRVMLFSKRENNEIWFVFISDFSRLEK